MIGRILVVDDEKDILELLSGFLSQEGFHVETADGGRAALERVQDQSFDVVITDMRMPGMDGLEASKYIKNDQSLSKIPAIILVTAYGREEVLQDAENIGLDGFLLKPVNPSVLFDSVMMAFGKEGFEPAIEAIPHTVDGMIGVLMTAGEPEA